VSWGVWSLAPLAVTLLLAFWTRSALLSMLAGAFVGTLMLGAAPGAGLNELFQASLGIADFIWVCQIVVLIGILFQLFRRAGVLAALVQRFGAHGGSRRRVELTAWGMGIAIVDDYFSPLMSGTVLRPLSDRARIPREKLAFLLDATTASVCILVPFTAWGAYLASLIAAQSGAVPEAPMLDAEQALTVFIGAIGYNFYPILMLILALLLAAGLLPDFGPMRRAERRVRETGALIRPGGRPLNDDAGDDIRAGERPSLVLELVLPIAVILGIGVGTLIWLGTVKIVEAFGAGVLLLGVVLAARRKLSGAGEAADLIVAGTRSVVPALLIVAVAYALNAVTQQLGAGAAVASWMAIAGGSGWLVVSTFAVTALLSFATGTSWGAFAMMMPLALPAAWSASGGELTPLVYQTIAAVAGGGIFGDHASPVSDTTVLASIGAGSDHMDHVITQLPYALTVAGLTVLIYLII
jgi:Na+/H+ antiporter NhaC